MAVRPWNHPKAEEMLTTGRNAAIGPKVPGALPADFERAHAAALMRRQWKPRPGRRAGASEGGLS